MKQDTYRVLVLPDIHVPFHDVTAIDAVIEYAKDEHWDEFIQLGDFVDLDVVSRFVIGKPGAIEGRRLSDDYDMAGKLLDRLLSAVRKKNPSCKATLLEGNHEYRISRWLDSFPQLRGMLEVPMGLKLKERGVDWVEADSKGLVYRVRQANFIHGWYYNMHHAKKTLEQFDEGDIWYGHVHDMEESTKVAYGVRKRRGGSLGCLCALDLDYTQGRPTKWQHGFGVFAFAGSTYATHRVRIDGGEFVAPNGKLYGNKRRKNEQR